MDQPANVLIYFVLCLALNFPKTKKYVWYIFYACEDKLLKNM